MGRVGIACIGFDANNVLGVRGSPKGPVPTVGSGAPVGNRTWDACVAE